METMAEKNKRIEEIEKQRLDILKEREAKYNQKKELVWQQLQEKEDLEMKQIDEKLQTIEFKHTKINQNQKELLVLKL